MGTRFIRSFASAFTTVMLIQPIQQSGFGAIDWMLLGLLAVGYFVFIWLRRPEWPMTAYAGLAALAIAVPLILQWRHPDGELGFA